MKRDKGRKSPQNLKIKSENLPRVKQANTPPPLIGLGYKPCLAWGRTNQAPGTRGPLKGENKGHKKGNLERENLQKETGPTYRADQLSHLTSVSLHH